MIPDAVLGVFLLLLGPFRVCEHVVDQRLRMAQSISDVV